MKKQTYEEWKSGLKDTKAGGTEDSVETHIRITHITDEENQDLVGKTGRLTHPYNGIALPGYKYIAGVRLDVPIGVGPVANICNLLHGDKYEVIK